MASATSPSPSQTTLSVPRVRFLFASIFLLTASIFTISRVMSGTVIPALYKTAMSCSVLVQLLTFKLTVPIISFGPELIDSVTSSPVLPHLMLSIYLWFNSTTFLVQLISMFINYLFVALEYVPTDETLRNNSYWRVYGKPWADNINPKKALLVNLAAHLEILNLVLILVSIIRMKGNLANLMVFTQYLVSQYISSQPTKHAIIFWDTIVSRLLNDPRCPPIVKTVESKIRLYLQKLLSVTSQFIKPPRPPHQSSNHFNHH